VYGIKRRASSLNTDRIDHLYLDLHERNVRVKLVCRKITRGLARTSIGPQDTLHLGNLVSKRDWGHARDYVCAPWLMLQSDVAEDFVIATEKQFSVRHFVESAGALFDMKIEWRGKASTRLALIR
jgi:GDPmannose 4,6-dehydratase